MSLPLMLKFCGRRCWTYESAMPRKKLAPLSPVSAWVPNAVPVDGIVDRGGVAGVRQDGLLRRVGQRVQNLLPVAPAEFELVVAAVPRVVLLAAEDLGVLAARHDAVQAARPGSSALLM